MDFNIPSDNHDLDICFNLDLEASRNGLWVVWKRCKKQQRRIYREISRSDNGSEMINIRHQR